MNNDQIFAWILQHGKNYPGKHLEAQPRTVPNFKPLEPKSQFHIIFKSLAEYIRENLRSGKSVNLRGFGAFSFEIISDLVKPVVYTTVDFKKGLDEQRAERKHVHKTRPCFMIDNKLKYYMTRYHGKEEISAAKSQHSVFQQGFGMIFCNPGPIAASCYLGKEVVQSALQAFVTAICDLTQLGYSMDINFGFCVVKVVNRSLTFKYDSQFVQELNNTNFEHKLKKSEIPTDSLWKTTLKDKWNKSALSSLYKKPPAEKVQGLAEKTLALKIMSLDLNTTQKTVVGNKLPQIKQ